jgi:hypothetical protein
MAIAFTTEIRESPSNKYLKVFLHDLSDINKIRDEIENLSCINNVNITENKKDDLTVYPKPTCDIEETQQEVEQFLSEYFDKNPEAEEEDDE